MATCSDIYGGRTRTHHSGPGSHRPTVSLEQSISKENLARYLALSKEAVATHPALLFWPEYAIDFYVQDESPYREMLFREVQAFKADLIFGGPHYSVTRTGTQYHNSVFLLHQETIAARYDKIRLVPLAEQHLPGWSWLVTRRTYDPGRTPVILRTPSVSLGAFVCFEAMYPELVREFARQGAEVLVNPTNDDWFGAVSPALHHLAMARVRAIENRRYLIRPTSTGFSAVIDPYGGLVEVSDFGVSALLPTTLFPSHTWTLYQWWGDGPLWGILFYLVSVSLSQWNWHHIRLLRRNV